MFYKTYLIKYGEIGVKGKNRASFEDALVSQIREALSRIGEDFHVWKEQGRIIVDVLGDERDTDSEEIIRELQTVFGIVGICPVVKAPLGTPEEIAPHVVSFLSELYRLKIDDRWREKHGEQLDGSAEGLSRFTAEGPISSILLPRWMSTLILGKRFLMHFQDRFVLMYMTRR